MNIKQNYFVSGALVFAILCSFSVHAEDREISDEFFLSKIEQDIHLADFSSSEGSTLLYEIARNRRNGLDRLEIIFERIKDCHYFDMVAKRKLLNSISRIAVEHYGNKADGILSDFSSWIMGSLPIDLDLGHLDALFIPSTRQRENGVSIPSYEMPIKAWHQFAESSDTRFQRIAVQSVPLLPIDASDFLISLAESFDRLLVFDVWRALGVYDDTGVLTSDDLRRCRFLAGKAWRRWQNLEIRLQSFKFLEPDLRLDAVHFLSGQVRRDALELALRNLPSNIGDARQLLARIQTSLFDLEMGSLAYRLAQSSLSRLEQHQFIPSGSFKRVRQLTKCRGPENSSVMLYLYDLWFDKAQRIITVGDPLYRYFLGQQQFRPQAVECLIARLPLVGVDWEEYLDLFLVHPTEVFRLGAFGTLGALPDVDSRDWRRVLDEKSDEVRLSFIRGLLASRDWTKPSANLLEILRTVLRMSSGRVQRQLLGGLFSANRTDNEGLVPLMIDLAAHIDEFSRTWLMATIRYDKAFLPVLESFTKDPDSRIRAKASDILDEMGKNEHFSSALP